jgi:hypothetical protein
MTRLGHYGVLALIAAGLLGFWLAFVWFVREMLA